MNMLDKLIFLGNYNDPDYKAIVMNMPGKLIFLVNYKDPDSKAIVMNMLNLGCSRSVKIHFLRSHTDSQPPAESLGSVREKQGGRFHLDIKDMERKYQGRCVCGRKPVHRLLLDVNTR
ncbi:hypothetical protein TNCT_128531 [Trichonephila clavata]|uniref:Uncharacterized protein n=1 Tax=Trichonephila clavata TaxID=2740835 RepID=A0A8X6IB32_TRICU|nr:hypothetical protein TNCT_128531 [Trichonephila clavata]